MSDPTFRPLYAGSAVDNESLVRANVPELVARDEVLERRSA